MRVEGVTSNRSHDKGNGVPVQVHLVTGQVVNHSFFHFFFFSLFLSLGYTTRPSHFSKSLRRSILSIFFSLSP